VVTAVLGPGCAAFVSDVCLAPQKVGSACARGVPWPLKQSTWGCLTTQRWHIQQTARRFLCTALQHCTGVFRATAPAAGQQLLVRFSYRLPRRAGCQHVCVCCDGS
jgi:hypothetical protein